MIRADQTHLPVVALTHPGMTGKNNEDRYSVTSYYLRSNPSTPALLAVLSDGIGGHRAGEVAAEMAVNTITGWVSTSTGGDPARILQESIREASQAIFNHAQEDVSRQGMGATCAVAWVIGSRLYAATVGDSRLYLMRGSAIRQLSTDHTWIQEALDQGYLQPEQARGHPNAHVIRRYLGSPTPPLVDIRLRLSANESDTEAESNQGFPLRPGDRLLLCSDGLTDLVEDGEILATFNLMPLEEAVQSLIDLANTRGGHDNITLIAVDIPAVRTKMGVPWLRRMWPLGCLGVIAATLVAAGLVFAGLWYFAGWPLPSILSSRLASATPTSTATTTAIPTRSPTQTLRPEPTQILVGPGTAVPFGQPTRTPLLSPPGAPTLTPWPTNTPKP